MQSLREFIAARRAQLVADLAVLEERRVAIGAELAELDAAAAALGHQQQAAHFVADKATVTQTRNQDKRPTIRKGSIKDMVVTVLDNRPYGADANTILALIKDRFNEDIARPSLSPQLSRLKDDGWVTLDAKVWSLVPNNETPDVRASGVSNTGGVDAPPNESQEDDNDLFG